MTALLDAVASGNGCPIEVVYCGKTAPERNWGSHAGNVPHKFLGRRAKEGYHPESVEERRIFGASRCHALAAIAELLYSINMAQRNLRNS